MEQENLKTSVECDSTKPVSIFPCDRKDRIWSYSCDDNVLEVLSKNKETWTLKIAGSNELIIGFGNVFFVRQYREELLTAFQGNEKYFRWLWDWFDASRFQMVEMPMMLKINPTG